jgi:hypothetical protein
MGFMGRAHLLVGAGAVLTASAFLGCSSNQPKQAARQPAAIPVPAVREVARPVERPHAGAPGEPRIEAPAARVGDVAPQSLAQHAEVYAHNLETLLAKRGGAAGGPAAPDAVAPDQTQAPVAPPAGQPARRATPKAVETEIAATATATADEVPAVPNTGMQVAPPQPEHAAPARAPTTRPAQAVAPRGQQRKAAPDAGAQPAAARSPSVASTADQLLQKLSTRVKDYPRDAAAHLDYQLLQFVRDESVPELPSIAPLPAEDRELLTALLDGISNFRNGLRAESNMLQAKKVAPLLEMGDRIRGQGELTIPAIALCTSVTTFGVYEPMEPAEFKSGPNNAAVLYCEVANFSSQLNEKKQWETRLKHEAVIYSETGLDVWQDKADTVTDFSRNRRHDFYVVKKLRLPNLPVGRYLLKITVTDLQMNRVAEATVPIQMVAPQS